MFVGCWHGDEIIVLQDGCLDYPPVVTYFIKYNTKRHLWNVFTPVCKFFWNHKKFCLQVFIYLNILPLDAPKWIKGDIHPMCGHPECTAPQKPDVEEQWFCWSCKNWFHSECLLPGVMTTQAKHLDDVIYFLTFQSQSLKFPTSLPPEVEVYYISGNICLVNATRQCLCRRLQYLLKPMPFPYG